MKLQSQLYINMYNVAYYFFEIMKFVFLSEVAHRSFCVKFSCLISEQTPLNFFIKKFSPLPSRQSEIALTPLLFPPPLYINNDRSLSLPVKYLRPTWSHTA